MFYGDSSYSQLITASGKKLVTMGLPAEVSAASAASVLVNTKQIPKTAKIGILSGNEPAIKAAGDSAEAVFKKAGYNIANKTEINVTGQATADQLKDATAAVATMKAAGVTDVIVTVPFTVNTGFFNQAAASGVTFHYNLVDYGGSLCTQFGASSVPATAAAAGMSCVTIFDTKATPTEERHQAGHGVRGQVPHDLRRRIRREVRAGRAGRWPDRPVGHRSSSRTSPRVSARCRTCSCRR